MTPNDDTFDAFYICDTIAVVPTLHSRTVTLYRPFAQLNVGTSDLDDATITSAYPNGVTTTITTTAYATMDLLTGVASNPQTVTWSGIKPRPEVAQSYTNPKPLEPFPVDSYEYLAMVYLLQNPTKETQSTTISFANGTTALPGTSFEIPFVPYRRNYQTNIFGNLMTNNVQYNVTIDPIFNKPFYMPEVTVSTQQQLVDAINDSRNDIIINLTPGVDYVLPPIEGYRPVLIRGAAPTVTNGVKTYPSHLTVNHGTVMDVRYLSIDSVTLTLPDNDDRPLVTPFSYRVWGGLNSVFTNGRSLIIRNCNVTGAGINIYGMETFTVENVNWNMPALVRNEQGFMVNLVGNVNFKNCDIFCANGPAVITGFYANAIDNTVINIDSCNFTTNSSNKRHPYAVELQTMNLFQPESHVTLNINNLTYSGYDTNWGFLRPNYRTERATVNVDGTQVWPLQ